MSALKEALATLKQDGIRITPQRHAILEYLSSTYSHPTADEIFRALEERFPNMSVATVYNNLRVFKDTGLVMELTYGDASSRFDFTTQNHYHIICQQCAKIVDFQYPGIDAVEDVAARLTNFKVDTHRLEIYGICPECNNTEIH